MPIVTPDRIRKRGGRGAAWAIVMAMLLAIPFVPVNVPIPFTRLYYLSSPYPIGFRPEELPFGMAARQRWSSYVYSLRLGGWVWEIERPGLTL